MADLGFRRRPRMWVFFLKFLPANPGAMPQIRLRQLERIGVLAVVLPKDSNVLGCYDVSLCNYCAMFRRIVVS